MHLDVVGHGGQIAGVAGPSGDLERDQGHPPRALRWPQRLIDAPDVENEYPPCTQLDRMAQWNAVDQAAVEVVPPVNDRGWEQPGHGCGSQHGVHDGPAVEPVLGSVLDVRRATGEGDGQVFDALLAQDSGERAPQRIWLVN